MFVLAVVWSLLGLGIFTAPVVTTIAVVGYSTYSQRKKAKEAASEQRKYQKQQAILAGQQRAIQQAPISAKQMKMFMGQKEIKTLVDEFSRQDQAEPQVYTLPASREPPGIVDRINLWMDQALRS